ncbi:hypothetical protein V6N13_109100 [Hibiscus sabdariffa]
MDRTEMRMQNQEAALKSLENQVGQISQVLNTRQWGGFPSDTEVAKVPDEPAPAKDPASVDKDYDIPPPQKETEPTVAIPQPKLPRIDTLEDIRPPPPFPQRLKKQKLEYQFKKFFDILK